MHIILAAPAAASSATPYVSTLPMEINVVSREA